MNMMLWKEWRETVRWLPIPMSVFAILVWMSMPGPGTNTVGIHDQFAGFAGIAASITAGLLGLLQTLPESRPDARIVARQAADSEPHLPRQNDRRCRRLLA